MKIAIVYNRDSQAVINLFGQLNKEKYGMKTINAIKEALLANGHIVKTFEGDKNIIQNLEEFMPGVIAGEKPGLVFNLSYGIQGRSRYTHMPAILEMIGVPYIGSEPATHAMALDKVVTKMLLLQHGLPTPKFTVLDTPEDPIIENMAYPMIIKPKDEASSFGLKIVNNEEELREGAKVIYEAFHGPTLVEEYIDGREFNVGLMGNSPVEALPPVEILFTSGEKIYTHDDKAHATGDRVSSICPAPLTDAETNQLQTLAIKTFKALGCFDSARVDFRMDNDGNIYILEVNSMASMSPGASYVYAAKQLGMSYSDVVQRLIDVAYKRYFGTESHEPTDTGMTTSKDKAFKYLTNNRDKIEDELKYWTDFSKSHDHPTGIDAVKKKLNERMLKLGLVRTDTSGESGSYALWESKAGYQGGTLIVVPIDTHTANTNMHRTFRRDSEWLYGDGIAESSAGITCLTKTLDALKYIRKLSTLKLGIFAYSDEGQGMRYSGKALVKISAKASEVLVLQPGGSGGKVVLQRRGMKKFKLLVERDTDRVGSKSGTKDAYQWFSERFEKLQDFVQPIRRVDLSVKDIHMSSYTMMRPHQMEAILYLSYLDQAKANEMEDEIKKAFKTTSRSFHCTIAKLEERPPMMKRGSQKALVDKMEELAKEWNLPFDTDSSLIPTAAGDIPGQIPVVCGLSPSSKGLYTPLECINRRELVEKTLLLCQYLIADK